MERRPSHLGWFYHFTMLENVMFRRAYLSSLFVIVGLSSAGCSSGMGSSAGGQAGSVAGATLFKNLPGGSLIGQWTGQAAGQAIDDHAANATRDTGPTQVAASHGAF